MDFNAYQREAARTAIYGATPRIVNGDKDMEYLCMQLASEAGEVAGVRAKYLRDGFTDEEMIRRINKELGDVLWYVATICTELNLTMNQVAHANINKLQDRKERGTIGGFGDNR